MPKVGLIYNPRFGRNNKSESNQAYKTIACLQSD